MHFEVVAHTLFVQYMYLQLAALGRVKSMGRGVYTHAAETLFLQKVVISVTLCTE